MRTPNTLFSSRIGSLSSNLYPILLSILLVAATTAVIAIVTQFVDLGTIGIIYIVPVLVAALRLGLVPALVAAATGAACSAFFFYPPIFSFQAHDWQNQLDLVLFALVAIVISDLATRLRRHAELTEMRTRTDLLRDALIGSVSHELRTPLAAIMGAASVIGQSPAIMGDPRLAELANTVRDEAERLNNDIQNLLDATRISSEGVRPHLEWIDPSDIVNVAVERRRRRFAGRPIEIDVATDLPFVQCDAVLIDQALGQVLDNAAKYSPAGSPIRIEAASEAERVTISVIDKGAGFTAEERQRFSERFHRGERHRATTTGSGLGLWIARAFVTASGGKIDAESEGINRGSKVSISFPFVRDADKPAGRPADA